MDFISALSLKRVLADSQSASADEDLAQEDWDDEEHA